MINAFFEISCLNVSYRIVDLKKKFINFFSVLYKTNHLENILY